MWYLIDNLVSDELEFYFSLILESRKPLPKIVTQPRKMATAKEMAA